MAGVGSSAVRRISGISVLPPEGGTTNTPVSPRSTPNPSGRRPTRPISIAQPIAPLVNARKSSGDDTITAQPQSKERGFGLDGLRALAILAVILSHAGLQAFLVDVLSRGPSFIAPLARWSTLTGQFGRWGVELFFVLSGFLIGRILLQQEFYINSARGLGMFYMRRMCRIMPVFWLALAGNVLLEIYFHHTPRAVGEVVQHGLLIRNFCSVSLAFFPESWSLGVEEWFYLLFPACLYLVLRLTKSRADRVFLVCACVFYLVSLVLRIQGALVPGSDWTGGQRCTVIFRFDTIMTGVAAAWVSTEFPDAWKRSAPWALALGLVVSAAVYLEFWRFGPGGIVEAPNSFFAKTFRYSLLSLGFALLLPAASRWKPATENFLHRGARKIALWSYSIYLIHWPLFQILSAAKLPGLEAFGQTVALFVSKITLAVTLSALLFAFYEAPTTQWRERFGRKATAT